MRPPAGFEYLAGGPGHVLRLRRAMYGLRQAPRAWNKCLEAERTKRGFVQSNAEPGLWLLYGENGAVMCMFYVDDGLAAASSDEEAEALVDLVAFMFAIRRLGEPEDVLGIEVLRDWDAGTITLCHERKALALAEAFGVAVITRRQGTHAWCMGCRWFRCDNACSLILLRCVSED